MVLKIAIALGIVVATWIGGGTLAQIFSLGFMGWFIALFATTLVATRIFIWARFPIVSWFIYCLMLFVAYVGGTTFKYVMSDVGTFEVTQNIPVQMELVRRGEVRLTNVSDMVLTQANVTCSLYFDNGQRIQKDFNGGIGGQLFIPGASAVTKVVQNSDFDTLRTNGKITCAVVSAKFLNPVSNKLSLKIDNNTVDGRPDFYVTNNGSVAVKNIQIACVATDGQAVKVDIAPSYNVKISDVTVVGAGSTVKFTDNDYVFTYKRCAIVNALEI